MSGWSTGPSEPGPGRFPSSQQGDSLLDAIDNRACGMSEALAHGLTRFMLQSLRYKGVAETVSRSVYRLAKLPTTGDPD